MTPRSILGRLAALSFVLMGYANAQVSQCQWESDPAKGLFQDAESACRASTPTWGPTTVVTFERVTFDPSYKWSSGYCWFKRTDTQYGGYDIQNLTNAVRRPWNCEQACSLAPDHRAENCTCEAGYRPNADHTQCIANPKPAESSDPLSCSVSDGFSTPHPILLATGEKTRDELDWIDGGEDPLSFRRIYRSSWGRDSALPATGRTGLSRAWTHNHGWNLSVFSGVDSGATLLSPEGYATVFGPSNGNPVGTWASSNSADTLTFDGAHTWHYRIASEDRTLTFLTDGNPAVLQNAKLVEDMNRSGHKTSYTYDGPRLISITSWNGRAIRLTYDASGRLTAISTPDGRTMGYGFDANGYLSSVTYADGVTRQFQYQDARTQQGLTGIVDETGALYESFTYDWGFRAVSSQLAGGVDAYSVYYPMAGSAQVTNPLGTKRTYQYGTSADRLAVTGADAPSATGLPDAASRTQDEHGLITSETDFKGVRKEYTWDVQRRLPLSVTEAAGTSSARTTTTQWHPLLSLPVRVEEPGRVTEYTHDNAGNVLSKAIRDTSTGQTWRTQYLYDERNLLIQITAPNGAVTRFERDAAGNVTRSINALNQTTRYTYDSANRLVRSTYPNGRSTAYAWDSRDRLRSMTAGDGTPAALTTSMTYLPTGKLATLALPTGQIFTYQYDKAHRLTGWRDNRGSQATYTLDAMGNRTVEDLRGRSGAPYQIYRAINALNQEASVGPFTTEKQSFKYDGNGQVQAVSNSLNQVRIYSIDALERVQSVVDEVGSQARLDYDAHDAITKVTDFKGVATSYQRDAQGHANAESSPDIGQRQIRLDALGLPQTIVDSIGRATNIERDLLGRPVRIIHADGSATALLYDQQADTYSENGGQSSVGFLSEIQDPGLITRYRRDLFGRIVLKTQIMAEIAGASNAVPLRSQSIQYTWAPAGSGGAGQLASITYPSGRVLAYRYDATGQLVGLDWNGSALLTSLELDVKGQPIRWSRPGFSGSFAQSLRSYDAAGRLINYGGGTFQWDSAGRLKRSVENLLVPRADGSRYFASGVQITTDFGYDPVGRLTGYTKSRTYGAGTTAGIGIAQIIGPDSASYQYDANGNRTQAVYVSSQADGSTRTVKRDYIVSAGDNRITGYTETQSTTASPGSVSTSQSSNTFNPAGEQLNVGGIAIEHGANRQVSATVNGGVQTRYDSNALAQRARKRWVNPKGYSAWQTSVYADDLFENSGPSFSSWPIAQYTETAEPNQPSHSVEYLYLPTGSGPLPVAVQIDNQLYGIQADHLNTPRIVFDAQGNTLWQWAFSGFGETPPGAAADGFAVDGNSYPIGNLPRVTFDLRYPGQVADAESGLFYNHHRYYDPLVGRYISSDPIGLAGGWNRFGYVDGNPLKFVDPRGLAKDSITASIEAAVVRGDAAHLQALIEGEALNPAQLQLATQGIQSIELMGRTTSSLSRLAQIINRSTKDVKSAMESCKRGMRVKNAPTKNPDMRVDPTNGEVYPDLGNGRLGDSIGNIFEHLP